VGLHITCWKESADQLELSVSSSAMEHGLMLTFINYKGELLIGPERARTDFKPASPGLGLLTRASQPLLFRSLAPIQFSAVALFIPADWIDVFLKTNPNFIKIDQALEGRAASSPAPGPETADTLFFHHRLYGPKHGGGPWQPFGDTESRSLSGWSIFFAAGIVIWPV